MAGMEILNELPSHHVSYLFDFSDPSLHYRSTDPKESSWQPAFLQALEPQMGLPLPIVEAPSPCSESLSGTSPQVSLLHSTLTQDTRRHSLVRAKERPPASSIRLSCHPYVRHAVPANSVVKGNGSFVTAPIVQNSKLIDSGCPNGSPPSYNSAYDRNPKHSNSAQLSCALPGPGMIHNSPSLQSSSGGESIRINGCDGVQKTPASTHAFSDGSVSSVVVGESSAEGCHLDQLLDFMLADSHTMDASHDSFKTWFPQSSIHAPLPSHGSLVHPTSGFRSGKLSDCFSKLHKKTDFDRGENVAVPEKFLDGFQSAITQGLTSSTDNATVEGGFIAHTPSAQDVGMWDRCKKIYNGLEEIFGHQSGADEASQSFYGPDSAHAQSQALAVKPIAGSTHGNVGQCCPVDCAEEEQSRDSRWQAKVNVGFSLHVGEGEGIDKPCDSLIPQTPGQISSKDNVETEFGKKRGFGLTSLLDSHHQQHAGVKAESDYSEVCLVHLLIAGAEAVAARDMDLASVILVRLKELVACPGSTMRRVAAYFSEGLQCRIEGGQPLKHPPKIGSSSDILAAFQILHEISPYIKFGHFTANQAILEAIQGEKRVHIVDYEIMEGIQWPAFMQALVLRKGGPPQQLRITALCRTHHMERKSAAAVHETGKRLTDFASSLNLPFTFGLLKVEKEEEFSASSLKLVKGEALVVNCMLQLPHMPHRTATAVSSFLRGMRKLSPIVLTLVEEELGCSSTAVASYFFEALHHYSAICDSLEACLSNEGMARMLVERIFLQPRISSAVTLWSRSCSSSTNPNAAAAAAELSAYNWCSLVRSVGFKSLPLSFHNLSQARLLLGLYRDGFKLDERSNRLLLGWRSKHLFAASVWN